VEGPVTAGLDARLMVTRSGGFVLDAHLAIAPGMTVALLGPNGAGKSTVVSALAGLIPIDDGVIVLGGVTLDDPGRAVFVPPEERRVGVVFQDYVLFPHMTIVENVAFGLRSRGVERAVALAAAVEWLNRLSVADLAARRPDDLSGGQAQRVALARALVIEPDLLLLDEPLSALDVTTRVDLRRTLSDHLEGFPGPRLLITHDPTEASLLADEIYILEDGAVTQVGGPDDIRLRPRTRYIADLAGSNLVVGSASEGVITTSDHVLHIADLHIAGDVLATIHPRAVALHRHEPEGSPRNTWETTVIRVEYHGDRVRLQTGDPLPLTAEITPGAVDALELSEGSAVWLSIKATEVAVDPA